MKILIFGYDAEVIFLTGKILGRSGHDVMCCCSEEELTALIKDENIGLVIAELKSDEAEMIRFCKTVKSIEKPPKLLLIGRSGEEEIPMLGAGADDWIKKPYKTDVLLARISALLRRCENV